MALLSEAINSVINDPDRLRVLGCYAPNLSAQPKELSLISDLLVALSDCPIALVSLVGAQQQHFAGRSGTLEAGTATDLSFCAYTVAQADSGAFIVPDTLEDERFMDHPMVQSGPRVRFYAGVPIIIDKQAIGTVCVLDVQPHADFDATKLAHLNHCVQLVQSFYTLSESKRRGEVSQRSLLQSQRRYRLALLAADIVTWEWDLATDIVESDDHLRDWLGIHKTEPLKAADVFGSMLPEDRDKAQTILTDAMTSGADFEVEYQVAATGRCLLGIGQFFDFDEDGKPKRAVGVNIDATEKRRQEMHSRFMLREINHRVKNTLAILQSLAAQTLRRSSSAEEFMTAFSGRLQSIAAAHTLLSEHEWGAVYTRGLIDVQVRPFTNDNPSAVEVHGPDIDLEPDEALGLCLLLHELATNAHKFGALTVPGGIVRIDLSIDPVADMIELHWKEMNGPKVSLPTTKGFGSILIDRSMDKVIGSKVDVSYAEDGFQAFIRMPAKGRKAEVHE